MHTHIHANIHEHAWQVDDATISGVYKGTVVRGESDIPGGMLRVADCHDAVIYVLAPLQVSCLGWVHACEQKDV